MQFRLRRLFLFTSVVAVGLMIYRWWPMDGLWGVIAPVWGDSTVWAQGYTDAGFRAVQTGMKRSEVYALLGQPLSTYSDPSGEVTEEWTQQRADSFDCSLYIRQVSFQGDLVVGKFAEFSPD